MIYIIALVLYSLTSINDVVTLGIAFAKKEFTMTYARCVMGSSLYVLVTIVYIGMTFNGYSNVILYWLSAIQLVMVIMGLFFEMFIKKENISEDSTVADMEQTYLRVSKYRKLKVLQPTTMISSCILLWYLATL